MPCQGLYLGMSPCGLGHMPHKEAPRKFLPLKLSQRSHPELAFPLPTGQLMELSVTGPATLSCQERQLRPRRGWTGEKGVGASRQEPCLGHLLTLPLVATFEVKVTAPSDLS